MTDNGQFSGNSNRLALSPNSIKQQLNQNQTLDISDIMNQSNDKATHRGERENSNRERENMFIIFIDTSSEIQKQIMKNDTEIECYNKEIREIQKKIDGLNMNHLQNSIEQLSPPSTQSLKQVQEEVNKIE